jgi:hypothetical protein
MGFMIRALEATARRLLGAAVALRGFRGSPDDTHALAHAALAQLALDAENCNGTCACDTILDALERKRRPN